MRKPTNIREALAHLRSVGLVRTPAAMAVRRIYGVHPHGPLSWCMLWTMYQGLVPRVYVHENVHV